jgi:hypothetical protein
MNARERDPEFVRFAKRTGIVTGAAVSVLLLARMVLSAATSDVRAMLASESRQRITADSLETHERQLTDRRLDRLATITELMVLAIAEQTDVVERREALAQLRRMRRVAP